MHGTKNGTDGTSRYHERREEKKRDKRGRGRGRDLDFDPRRGIWNREDGRMPAYRLFAGIV